jgi:hypothetical protein
MAKKLLKVFLDDERTPSQIYGDGADNEWVTVSTVEEVFKLLKTGCVTHLSLDNDLGLDNGEGHTVIAWMIEHNHWPTEELFAHSSNPYWRKCMEEDIKRYYYGRVKSKAQT